MSQITSNGGRRLNNHQRVAIKLSNSIFIYHNQLSLPKMDPYFKIILEKFKSYEPIQTVREL